MLALRSFYIAKLNCREAMTEETKVQFFSFTVLSPLRHLSHIKFTHCYEILHLPIGFIVTVGNISNKLWVIFTQSFFPHFGSSQTPVQIFRTIYDSYFNFLSSKHEYNFYNKPTWRMVHLKYVVLGFKLSTSRTWVSFQYH